MNTNRIPRMAPSEPGWLYRVYCRAMDALHDKAERIALENRVIALDALEEEVRAEVAVIRYPEWNRLAHAFTHMLLQPIQRP